jgi:PLP dependent protein
MKNHIDEIIKRIEVAKMRSGRNTDEILLVTVSKTQAYNRLLEVQSFGLNTFGENKVQELLEKHPLISNATWHFIGHLQKNKVKYIVDKVDLIHSVDSIELAKEIDKRAGIIGKKMPILIQINIGKEVSKSGIFEDEVPRFLSEVSLFDNLLINGFMTVPPINNDVLLTRSYFKKMKKIFTTAKDLNYNNFNIKYLSMGMTDDFEIAIEEGANIVRIGSGIFGKRVYKEE